MTILHIRSSTRINIVVMNIVVAVVVVQLLWGCCHPTRSILRTAHAFRNGGPAKTIQTRVSNRRLQITIKINFCRLDDPDAIENDVTRRSENMTKLPAVQTSSTPPGPTMWEKRSGMMISTRIVTDATTIVHTTRRDNIKTMANFVFSTAVLLGVAAFPSIARSTTTDLGNNDECQTVCMYKCLQHNTSSSSRSSSSSISSKCTEQCGSTNAGSSSTMVCSSTTPETTMTREPKLLQSSRIENLYETWQDKFCVDENSICEGSKQ